MKGSVGLLVDTKADAVEYFKRFGFFELSILWSELGDRAAPTMKFLELGAIQKILQSPSWGLKEAIGTPHNEPLVTDGHCVGFASLKCLRSAPAHLPL